MKTELDKVNYCGISLMTGFAKLFEKWLLSKLEVSIASKYSKIMEDCL